VKQQQQQQQQHHMTAQGPQPDFFKPNVHDPLNQIQANFGELNIKEPPVQWIIILQRGGADEGFFDRGFIVCVQLFVTCSVLKVEVTVYR